MQSQVLAKQTWLRLCQGGILGGSLHTLPVGAGSPEGDNPLGEHSWPPAALEHPPCLVVESPAAEAPAIKQAPLQACESNTSF